MIALLVVCHFPLLGQRRQSTVTRIDTTSIIEKINKGSVLWNANPQRGLELSQQALQDAENTNFKKGVALNTQLKHFDQLPQFHKSICRLCY